MRRESGIIKLPSQRTLRDYTYYTEAVRGFSEDIDSYWRQPIFRLVESISIVDG